MTLITGSFLCVAIIFFCIGYLVVSRYNERRINVPFDRLKDLEREQNTIGQNISR